LQHALSCWHNRKFGTLREDFIKKINKLCGVSVYDIDFGKDEKIAEKMNAWIERNTHGLIKNVGMKLDSSTILCLIDTLYLCAEWFKPFDKKLTTRSMFCNADGSKSEVDMMHRLLPLFNYYETKSFQTILLDYNDGLSLSIVKPKGKTDLYKLMTEKFDVWTQAPSKWADVDFYMPRFKIKGDLDLKQAFKHLELSEMFGDTDVFSNMSDFPSVISEIQQKCEMEVDEKGTKAASSIETNRKLGTPPKVKTYGMRLDRPFGFAIYDFWKKGEPLFVGVVNSLPDLAGKESRK